MVEQTDYAAIAMVALPILFVVMWVAITGLAPKFTGWAKLETLFPNREDEAPLEALRFQALYIGKQSSKSLGVSYGGCVTLEPCQLGLRIRIWKLFAPFSSPIFLPWEHVETQTVKSVGIKMCGIVPGIGSEHKLAIISRSARRIAQLSDGAFQMPADQQK